MSPLYDPGQAYVDDAVNDLYLAIRVVNEVQPRTSPGEAVVLLYEAENKADEVRDSLEKARSELDDWIGHLEDIRDGVDAALANVSQASLNVEEAREALVDDEVDDDRALYSMDDIEALVDEAQDCLNEAKEAVEGVY